ncbi:NADP-dependent phosphogluconate dehydrogenase [Echinimonas agarilytica]|uniref:6-phosphogluconate dehydrogenase, decarboxylating n=1 Tax=Echinimonas agarilytica TaxID=1215918 RepID=A0AA41W5X2_9GAMM|nr:NADP-dependent phosphogluconate dehydrogenase [Echinimonas agarilytica]MCM2679470.1 NADP-dependent phosphogluconate dehydrogenase [Echinimonas agarilytica]
MTQLCDIGFIGLGVMGKNLVMNLVDHGYTVAAFDLDQEKIDGVLAQDQQERGDKAARVVGCNTLETLLASTKQPHLIILSVPAGKPVDIVSENLLKAGMTADAVVVDTGNTLWTDTVERTAKYEGQFTLFSTAVSGGEVGARFGPALMPSGDAAQWERLAPVWEAIAAKVDPDTGKPLESYVPGQPVTEGEPCAAYIGPAGAGHYVKMVHNGIEYADMQQICEAYQVMREVAGMSCDEIGDVFEEWNKGPLNSYLIEISADILKQKDAETGKPVVDVIKDTAGQKGTGLWTAISSLEVGSPNPSIAQSVFARALSSMKTERVAASQVLKGPQVASLSVAEKEELISQLHDALYCSKLCVYAQGFHLMKLAGEQQGWDLDFASIAKIFRAGCIIRAIFLQSITKAFEADSDLDNLLVAPFFVEQIEERQQNWRKSIAQSVMNGIPTPVFSASLAYYDTYRNAVVPANLLQAQRDFFGAHTFERLDKPAGEFYHIEWSQPERQQVRIK